MAVKIIKVLLVDDHEVVRAGVRQILAGEKDIQVVGEATKGEEVVKLVKEKTPDVVIMDIQMPGMGGLEAYRRILQRDPKVKVVILTSSKSEIFPKKLLQLGVKGYISKSSSLLEVLKGIRAAYEGKRHLSPDIAQALALQSTGEGQEAWNLLSEREIQVAMMISEGNKNKAIADKLNISPKTINTYRYRVYEKLKVHTDIELLHYVLKHRLIELDTVETGVV